MKPQQTSLTPALIYQGKLTNRFALVNARQKAEVRGQRLEVSERKVLTDL
jgi:hypothetical protein